MSTATIDTSPLLERPVLAELPVEHLFDMKVDLEPAQLIETAVGNRMIFISKGGRIEGPRLNGELLPGGGDFLNIGTDLVGRADIRATIRTDDDALIYYTGLGVIKIPADGLQRLADGERIPFEESYVRIAPRWETSDERYAWLSETVAISHNELSQDHIDYRIYKVL
jgi:hypothetical protein